MRWIFQILLIRCWLLAFIFINTSVQTKFIAITQKYFDEKGLMHVDQTGKFHYEIIRLPHLPGKVIYQANQMNQRCYLQIMVQFFLYICVCLAFEILVHSAKWCQRKLYCRKPLVSLGTWVWVEITEGRLNIQIPTIKTKLIYLIH